MSLSGKNVSVIIGIVMIAITFFIFPIVLDGCVEILTHASIATYTGLDSIVEVTPLILYVGLLFGGEPLSGMAPDLLVMPVAVIAGLVPATGVEYILK